MGTDYRGDEEEARVAAKAVMEADYWGRPTGASGEGVVKALLARARAHEREVCLGRHAYTCATCKTEVRTHVTATTILCPECTWRDMEAKLERAEADNKRARADERHRLRLIITQLSAHMTATNDDRRYGVNCALNAIREEVTGG